MTAEFSYTQHQSCPWVCVNLFLFSNKKTFHVNIGWLTLFLAFKKKLFKALKKILLILIVWIGM